MADPKTPFGQRAVWFDLPVVELDRAIRFYGAVLDVEVHRESFGDAEFAVLEHGPGNGGCLVVKPNEVAADSGILVYMSVEGRLAEAEAKVAEHGGKVLEPAHPIGPHGHRALVLDSEGNRIALHSTA